jgi:spermidine synthase
LSSPEYAVVARSLSDVGFHSAVDLLSTFAGNASDLNPWLADAFINRDLNLRLQYLAGMGVNLNQAHTIYTNMVSSGVGFPESLFAGSEPLMGPLRTAIESGRTR